MTSWEPRQWDRPEERHISIINPEEGPGCVSHLSCRQRTSTHQLHCQSLKRFFPPDSDKSILGEPVTMQLLFRILVLTSLMTSVSCALREWSQSDKDRILELHNQYRRQEGAADMALLEWDSDLERDAARWADSCNFSHEPGTREKEQGENLYFETSYDGDGHLKFIENGMQSWYDEKKDHRWNTACYDACHYTQIVWAATLKVGCAGRDCRPLRYGCSSGNCYLLVCRYSPEGNHANENPYVKGPGCSKCPAAPCDNGLCVGGSATCEDKNSNCEEWSSRGECDNNPGFMRKDCRKSCNLC